MGIYRDLGRNPGIFRVLISQLTARFPFGMLSIIMLLHIQHAFGDYTSAGVILAAELIVGAVSSMVTNIVGVGDLDELPVLRSKLMDLARAMVGPRP